MDKPTRNLIQSATQRARRLLEDEFGQQLEGDYDILPDGTVLPQPGPHLDAHGRLVREKLTAALRYREASGMAAREAREATLREAAFTTLNRFVALKMLEARGVVQECVSKGEQSAGFREFGGMAEGLIALPDRGYRLYLETLFDEIGREVRVLFDRRDVAGLLWPRRQALAELLATLNDPSLATVWAEDETVGWVYQYFNGDDERKQMREASQVPRNSRELAVRNQFFTPRYVVAFLADNTLGRTWYEMRQGRTRLAEQCRYLVRWPNEVIPERALKDPRELRILDPASGSGHFLLYCFDLLLTIYAEAWDEDITPQRHGGTEEEEQNFRTSVSLCLCGEPTMSRAEFMKHVPSLILRHNLHGIDIDPRAAQIAELALWMRAQRAYADLGVRSAERPPIRRTNIVVAEPMPGDRALLAAFLRGVDERLRPLVQAIWEQMRLAGEAGSLLKIEAAIEDSLRTARRARVVEPLAMQSSLFGEQPAVQQVLIVDEEERAFWERAEQELLAALEGYARKAAGAEGVRRRLFRDNAEQGFAFIDTCRRHYDVVLMNPPFGAASKGWKATFERAYPRTKNDLYAAFVERGLELLKDLPQRHKDTKHPEVTTVAVQGSGLLGAITSRTGFFLTSFQKWREEILLREAPPTVFADLGAGVLDSAMVETAAYVLRKYVQ